MAKIGFARDANQWLKEDVEKVSSVYDKI